jgi:hypothetical protein
MSCVSNEEDDYKHTSKGDRYDHLKVKHSPTDLRKTKDMNG